MFHSKVEADIFQELSDKQIDRKKHEILTILSKSLVVTKGKAIWMKVFIAIFIYKTKNWKQLKFMNVLLFLKLGFVYSIVSDAVI